MKTWITVLLAVFVLQACTEDGAYPLTGKECAEDDPVHELDAGDCTIPGSAGATGL